MLFYGYWAHRDGSRKTLNNFKQKSYMAVGWKMDDGGGWGWDKCGKRETTQIITIKSQKGDGEGPLGSLGIEILKLPSLNVFKMRE